MGALEEGIIASLARLREAQPGAGRGMLVFPISMMEGAAEGLAAAGDAVRDGEVLLVRRPSPEDGEPSPAGEGKAGKGEAVRRQGEFLGAYTRALAAEVLATRTRAERALRDSRARRAGSGFEPFPLRSAGLTAAEIIEVARRMTEHARRLRRESEERRAGGAEDPPLALPPSRTE